MPIIHTPKTIELDYSTSIVIREKRKDSAPVYQIFIYYTKRVFLKSGYSNLCDCMYYSEVLKGSEVGASMDLLLEANRVYQNKIVPFLDFLRCLEGTDVLDAVEEANFFYSAQMILRKSKKAEYIRLTQLKFFEVDSIYSYKGYYIIVVTQWPTKCYHLFKGKFFVRTYIGTSERCRSAIYYYINKNIPIEWLRSNRAWNISSTYL